jgi:hypothetical protein
MKGYNEPEVLETLQNKGIISLFPKVFGTYKQKVLLVPEKVLGNRSWGLVDFLKHKGWRWVKATHVGNMRLGRRNNELRFGGTNQAK